MSAFFYTCTKYRDFRLLCTVARPGQDHFVLHRCLACGEQHLIDSMTGRVATRPTQLQAVQSKAAEPEAAEPERQFAAAAS